MPGLISISNTSLCNDLYTFDTFGSKLIFITFCTIDLVFLGYEWFCSNRIFACTADKAFFMPLSRLILHFLHTCSEYIVTAIASGCKLGIITRSTIDSIRLWSKLLIHQRSSTFGTNKAWLMPVFFLVWQILWIYSYYFSTFIAIISKNVLVAFYAIWMVISENVAMTSEGIVTVMTKHFFFVKSSRSCISCWLVFVFKF